MSKVAIIPAHSESIIEDNAEILNLLEYQNILDKNRPTIIKINLSWSLFYPACSTPPWQLDGVLQKLSKDGFKNIIPVENQTVVTHPWKGAYLNKWLPIMKKFNLEYRPLTNEKWIEFTPKSDMLGMNELFGEKLIIPEIFKDSNMVHLPTMKTHGHTVTTGAIKNAFGGLIPKYRHHSHKIIDEILVDLLAIQKEIHPGLLAVMDGTVAGDGAGPRTMKPFYPNIILASEDQVAIDAAAASMMGFDPLKIKYIKLAHDAGLGCGDVSQLEIIGMDHEEFRNTNFNCETKRSLVVRWDQRIRKTTYKYKVLKPIHWFMFYTPFFRLFIFASYIFHDRLWYPTIGKKKIKKFNETEWGELFNSYPFGEKAKNYPKIKNWNKY
ncbi:MAG: DUF362 domain-containing protein [Candidatus Hodarchaeales archaeon]|jgi:uncharacterized protein (DUF362 family)